MEKIVFFKLDDFVAPAVQQLSNIVNYFFFVVTEHPIP